MVETTADGKVARFLMHLKVDKLCMSHKSFLKKCVRLTCFLMKIERHFMRVSIRSSKNKFNCSVKYDKRNTC